MTEKEELERLREFKRRVLLIDWMQVILNEAQPCMHSSADGEVCGRAMRWPGHPASHPYVSLRDL